MLRNNDRGGFAQSHGKGDSHSKRQLLSGIASRDRPGDRRPRDRACREGRGRSGD